MSDLDLILAALATLDKKVEWLVEVQRFKLGEELNYQLETPVEDYEGDEEDEPEVVEAPAPVQAVCTHQHQSKRGDAIVCAKCGFVIIPGTGIGGASSQLGIGTV